VISLSLQIRLKVRNIKMSLPVIKLPAINSMNYQMAEWRVRGIGVLTLTKIKRVPGAGL
jgi:hypothetical protein